ERAQRGVEKGGERWRPVPPRARAREPLVAQLAGRRGGGRSELSYDVASARTPTGMSDGKPMTQLGFPPCASRPKKTSTHSSDRRRRTSPPSSERASKSS